jgi:cytochrome P450 family 6
MVLPIVLILALFILKLFFLFVVETMRLYPVVDLLVRKSSKDYQIPGTNLILEKDTFVFISLYAMHRDADIYEDPEKFDPERFSKENRTKSKIFMPFGFGPKCCIGDRFAMMSMKISIINYILNFKIIPCEKTTVPMEFKEKSLTLHPKYGMWLKFEKI